MMTIPELVAWFDERREQNIPFYRDYGAATVTLFADDGALTVSVALWDAFEALLIKYRPDLLIQAKP